ncbi:MAG TPA: lysophospholipid acyltransferase family protein [Thermoanaerobaculia bacterium]|nr:lysophospholipid acyltransferase family protein [Thermoanaerobaculia bacterium]
MSDSPRGINARPAAPAPTSGWLSPVATVTGNLYLVMATFILSLIGIVVSWIPPRGSWMFGIMRIWSNGLLAASMVRVEANYNPGLEAGRSYIFLSNHQSLYDIPVLLATCPGQVRMMAKRGLFQIPIFGWGLWAGGFIPVDRADRSTARQSFASAAERLRAGTSIALFPEGTRAPTDTLLPFQRGGFLLALKSGLPIVPVGIRGTRAVRLRGGLRIHPGAVVVSYGAPIEAAGYGLRRKRELIDEVRRQVAELADLELPAEAAGEGTG